MIRATKRCSVIHFRRAAFDEIIRRGRVRIEFSASGVPIINSEFSVRREPATEHANRIALASNSRSLHALPSLFFVLVFLLQSSFPISVHRFIFIYLPIVSDRSEAIACSEGHARRIYNSASARNNLSCFEARDAVFGPRVFTPRRGS